MRGFLTLGVLLTALATCAPGTSADKDAPEPEFPAVGSSIPGPFHVLNLNGERKGRFHCLVCRNSVRPTAAILARLRTDATDDGLKQLDADQPLAKLIKAFDAISDQYADAYLGTFAVFLSDDEKADRLPLERRLEELTKEDKLKQIVFAFDDRKEKEAQAYFPDGKGLKWGEPGIRVLLYSNFRVVDLQDFTKDRPLTDKDVTALEATFRKMVPPAFTDKKKVKR